VLHINITKDPTDSNRKSWTVRGSNTGEGKIFSSHQFRPALGPTHYRHPVSLPEVQQSGRDPHQPSSAEVELVQAHRYYSSLSVWNVTGDMHIY
jgi:hypothetical protein